MKTRARYLIDTRRNIFQAVHLNNTLSVFRIESCDIDKTFLKRSLTLVSDCFRMSMLDDFGNDNLMKCYIWSYQYTQDPTKIETWEISINGVVPFKTDEYSELL